MACTQRPTCGSKPPSSPIPTGTASAKPAVQTSSAALRADQAAWLAQAMSADDDCPDRGAGSGRAGGTIEGDGESDACIRSVSAPPATRSEPVTARTLGLAPYNRQLRGHPMRRAASVPRRVSERLKKPPMGYPPTKAQSLQLPPGDPPMIDTATKKPVHYPPTPSPSSTASSPPTSPVPRSSPQSKAARGTPVNPPSPIALTASSSARRLSPCMLPPSVALAASASAPTVATAPASAPTPPAALATKPTAPGGAILVKAASRTCVRPPAGRPPVLSHSLAAAQPAPPLQSRPPPRQLGSTPVVRPTPRNDEPLPPSSQPQLRTLRLTSGVPMVATQQLQQRSRPQAGGGTTPPSLQGPPLSMPGLPQQAKAASAPNMQPPNAMPLALARARSASAARARCADAASCMAGGPALWAARPSPLQTSAPAVGSKLGGAAPVSAPPSLLWFPTTPATARLARQEHWRRCEACGSAVAHRRRDGSAQCPSCGHTFRFALAPPLLPANSLSQLLQEARWQLEEAARAPRQQPASAGNGVGGGSVPAGKRRGRFARFRRMRRGGKPGGDGSSEGTSGDGKSSGSSGSGSIGRLPCTMSAYLKLKLASPFYAVQHGAPPPFEVELWT